jgi:hypothetical protein
MEQNKENKISETYYLDAYEYAETRKHIAVVKEGSMIIDMSRDTDESYVFRSDGSTVLYFYNLLSSYTEDGDLKLVFSADKYSEFEVNAKDCKFYSLNRPSVLMDIKNKLKLN